MRGRGKGCPAGRLRPVASLLSASLPDPQLSSVSSQQKCPPSLEDPPETQESPSLLPSLRCALSCCPPARPRRCIGGRLNSRLLTPAAHRSSRTIPLGHQKTTTKRAAPEKTQAASKKAKKDDMEGQKDVEPSAAVPDAVEFVAADVEEEEPVKKASAKELELGDVLPEITLK